MTGLRAACVRNPFPPLPFLPAESKPPRTMTALSHSSAQLPHPGWPAPTNRPVIGASACLLGQRVRYDGDHRYDPYLVEVLAKEWDLLPICPEVECGMGVPREPIHLVGDPAAPRLIGRESGVDHTRHMQRWVDRRLTELAAVPLSGFVCKSKSPSSGMRNVKVLLSDGSVQRVGVGLFARGLMARFPFLPVIDEVGLATAPERTRFVRGVRTVHHLRRCTTPAALVAFLRQRRASLLHEAPHLASQLEELLASSSFLPWESLWQRSAELLLVANDTLADGPF